MVPQNLVARVQKRIYEGEGGTYSFGRHEFCTAANYTGPHGQAPTAEKLHSHYQATGVYGAARPCCQKFTRPRLIHTRAFMLPANGTLSES